MEYSTVFNKLSILKGARELENSLLGNHEANDVEFVKSKIFELFSQNPSPTDDEVHQFAESNGIDIEFFEELVYSMFSKLAFKNKANRGELSKMPTSYIKHLSKKLKKPIGFLEDKWSKAEKVAKDQGKESDYGLITHIFKNSLHLKEEASDSISKFDKLLTDKARPLVKALAGMEFIGECDVTYYTNTEEEQVLELSLELDSYVNPELDFPSISPHNLVELASAVENLEDNLHGLSVSAFFQDSKINVHLYCSNKVLFRPFYKV